jgi:hypothetical protein
MIENITFGDISSTLTLIVGFIGAVGYLHAKLKKLIAHSLDEQLKTITKEMDSLQERLDTVDMESCKNFLVRCLTDFEREGQISETELERFWEQYGYYKEHGGNTYISKKVEKFEHEGRL